MPDLTGGSAALDFTIAGGGVAGLAAALALSRAGMQVAVFERRPGLDALGAGLQLSPNATRVARNLGILNRLEACATEPRRLCIRRGRDGGTIAVMPLGVHVRQRYGSPTLVLHRADLLGIMADAVSAHGVPLVFGTSLDGHASDGTASASGPGGPRPIPAGGVIRAGGLWGGAGASARRSGSAAWRALIPRDALPSGMVEPETNLWLGADAHIVHYPIRGGALVNVVVIVSELPGEFEHGSDPWARTGDPAILLHRLRGWHRDARHLVSAADGWRRWPLFEGRPGGRWSEARETRIGDAAHPMLPFLAQGASQAFEDAAALAEAARATRDPAAAFARFEAVRRPRAERVVSASRRQGRIYHLGGPAALARDLVMGALGPERLLARMDWLYGPVKS